MNIEFTEQDINKLNDLIKRTPFEFSYPLFLFFQGKVNEANQPKNATTSAVAEPVTENVN